MNTNYWRVLLAASSVLALAISVPSIAVAQDVARGQTLYLANCSGCHGSNGYSLMEEAPNLANTVTAETMDEDLVQTIQSGTETMPPYIGILSTDEIIDIISYLRTLN